MRGQGEPFKSGPCQQRPQGLESQLQLPHAPRLTPLTPLAITNRCSAKFLEASALVAEQTSKNSEAAQKILESQNAILGKSS